MKEKLLKKMLVMSLIFSLTMVNFLFVGFNMVSYAADILTQSSTTNNKNVEFTAYFKDDNGERVYSKDEIINAEDLKLYMEISVKNEGYFNGKVEVKESNFTIKPEKLSDSINSIEGNTINLNQINAGDKIEIEVGIEIQKDDYIDLDLLSMESKINLTGTYKDSKEKDITIDSEKIVKLILRSPYSKENNGIQLEQEIITNKVIQTDETIKKVVQVLIKSGLEDGGYPISETNISLTVPKIGEYSAESVDVQAIKTLATNGKTGEEFSEDHWEYSERDTESKVNIKVLNKADSNKKISWNKDGKDEFVVTYIYDEKAKLNQTKFEAESEIKLYDVYNTVLSAKVGKTVNDNEIFNRATVEVINAEDSIYKGKIYSNIDREIKNTTKVQINYVDGESISLEENPSYYMYDNNDYEANIIYKEIKINKSNFDYILGKQGYISFIDEKGNEIAKITSSTKANEEGYIVINCESNETKSVKAQIVGAVKIGELILEETKTIKQTPNIELEIMNSIKYTTKIDNSKVEKTIELKESSSEAEIEIDKKEISTLISNNVKIEAVLLTNDESKRLYKNPTLEIELPAKITDVQINAVNLIYGNGLEIEKAGTATRDGKTVIVVQLKGEQTKYTENITQGATVRINATLGMKKTETTSTETIKLSVANETENVEATTDIKIVSPTGLITVNSIENYGITALGTDNEQTATLEKSSGVKNANVNIELINNNESTIKDVTVLGSFPTDNSKVSETTNNIKVAVNSPIVLSGVDNVKVQYSTEADATSASNWVDAIEDPTTVKSYKIVIPEMAKGDILTASYGIQIPEGLEYNQTVKETFNVTYYNTKTSNVEEAKGAVLTLQTGAGPVVEAELTATVGGETLGTNAEVKSGEVIKYSIKVSNTGSEEAKGVNLVASIPEGTTYVTPEKRTYTGAGDEYDASSGLSLGYEGNITGYYVEDSTKKELTKTLDIEAGATVELSYEVKVNSNITDGSKIINKSTIKYGEVTKQTNETVNIAKQGNLTVTSKLMNVDKTSIMAIATLNYYVIVENTSDSIQKDVKVNLNMNGLHVNGTIEVSDIVSEEEVQNIQEVENTTEISVGDIKAKSSKLICVYAKTNEFAELSKDVKFSATASTNNTSYKSNDVIQKVYNYIINVEISATDENGYLKEGDIVEYTINIQNDSDKPVSGLTILDNIPYNLYVEKVEQDGNDITEDNYDNEFELSLDDIESKGETTVKISAVVDPEEMGTEPTVMLNDITVELYGQEVEKATITHIIQPTVEDEEEQPGENPDKEDSDKEDKEDEDKKDSEKTEGYMLSGVAWLDENKNGKKDSNEQLLSDITVNLIDISTGKIAKDTDGKELKTTTNSNGLYIFNKIPNGEYLVAFEYNSSSYRVTEYQKEGIEEKDNSNVISKKLTINDTEKTYAVTNTLVIKDNNISNINMGIYEASIFDLKLDKNVTKILVQNNNQTDVYNYDNATLAKVELDSKQINNTTVIIEYTITVTNNGEIDGYVKNIVDYIPSGLKFSSELNKDWYQSGSYLYNASLANTKLLAGESRTVTLLLTKAMTENNTGRINNTAEIAEQYNEEGTQDVNSTPGNKVQGENDMGSADVIISIKTGSIATYITLTIVLIAAIGAGAYFVNKKVMKEKI